MSGHDGTRPDPRERTIPALVDADWLRAHLGRVVVLDVRAAEAYAAGHVPGAVNEPFAVPFCAWITMRDGLLLELPDPEDLRATLGGLGIGADSPVTVVSAPYPGLPAAYGLAEATRVAMTLVHAGAPDVAVLDGGYGAWVRAGAPTSTEPVAPVPVEFQGRTRSDVLVTRQDVEERIGRACILDNRDADVYFGRTTEEFAEQPGHIPTARSLPAPWIWTDDGTFAPRDALTRMADGVIGEADREVVVYCGVGGYASAWWFVLTQVLGRTRVRFYDGSAQEWSRERTLVPYRWD